MSNDQLLNQEKETGRVEAFSDGVFAIAITLLVLNLKVPPVESLSAGFGLMQALFAQWPAYLAFVLSFVNILIMWVNHHYIFSHIRKADWPFFLLNGFLLLTVTFIPFPTSLLAEYIRTPFASLATAVFTGSILLNCLSFNLLWAYASQGCRLLKKDVGEPVIKDIRRNGRIGLALYLLAIPLAFINIAFSLGICLGLAIFYAALGSLKRRGAS
ncbi:MAG: TMEM175 family protein [Candidatus Omnitrophica bacterium]|nr:TMEM175 family protein [Candidatus Omnitrophota bacterium]